MVHSAMSRLWKRAAVIVTVITAALGVIAMTPQTASALPSYGYCTGCHSIGGGVSVSVVKTSETASQATYSISGSSANAMGQGWSAFNASQTKLASGSAAGSLTLPRDGLSYTVIWVNPQSSGNLTGAAVTTVVTSIPAPPAPAAPLLTGITPTSGLNSAVTSITINGANFVATPTVRLGTTVLSGVTFVSATRLTVSIPAGLAAGVYGVTVVNPDGQSAALGNAFTVIVPAPPAPAAPTLASVSPASGLNSAATSITISGANFVATPTVRLGTTVLSGVTFVSATRLTVSIPAGLAAGAYGITVVNPDGQSATIANAYTVTVPAPPAPAAPSLTGITPTSGLNNVSVVITIKGANFVATPSVKLGSTVLTGVSFVNASTLTVSIPAGLPGGIYGITVVNPDGQIAALSNVFTVTVPAPTPPPVVNPPRPGNDNGDHHVSGGRDNGRRHRDDRRNSHNDD